MVPIADLEHFSGVDYQGIIVFAGRGEGGPMPIFLVNYYVKYPSSQDPRLSLNANYWAFIFTSLGQKVKVIKFKAISMSKIE